MINSCRSVADLFVVLVCLTIISTVRGCGQMPSSQGRALSFSVSGFTLPPAMAFSSAATVYSQVPQISRSADAATALVRNLVMQAVNDVLDERGRSEGLPAFVVSAILSQLTIQVNYIPIRCDFALLAANPNQANQVMMGQNYCFILNDRVTALCNAAQCTLEGAVMGVAPIPDTNLRISGSVMTTNFIMANWSTQMWQGVLSRALQSLRRGPFGTHFAAASITVM